MGIFVTEDGFVKKTEAELVIEFEVSMQGIFGDDVDLDPAGPIGQLVAFLAKSFSDLYDGAEEIYTARNPSQATGTSLDYISQETGVKRIDATKTQVQDVWLYGTIGSIILTGKQVKQAGLPTLFSLLGSVTILPASCRSIEIIPDSTTVGAVISFTLNTELISYTVQTGDDESSIIDELITLIGATTFTGTATNIDGENLLLTDGVTNMAILTGSNIVFGITASEGNFKADDEGLIPVPASTLIEIATPVTGWASVTNPIAGISGNAVEEDTELRIRREVAFQVGKATEEAIRQNILQNVEGVSDVTITSNRTAATDGEGRPPHSFETIVEGGSDTAIGEEIWYSMPAGIEPYGLESVTIQDSTGRDQVIGYTRSVPQYIHVRVSIDTYDEESYPATGDDQIKQAIVDWSLTEFNMGTDVIYQRLASPIYSVDGIGFILIEVGATVNPGDTPAYASTNIEISARQLAEFDITRIIVQDFI